MASWFETWFDTKYYHILYQNRDQKEASFFIDKLVSQLGLEKGRKVLDLCCGKGRHSIQLNELGYDVLGVDLSSQSIAEAKNYENTSLQFEVHDMREPLVGLRVDAVFNLFTSFGYFDNLEENKLVLSSIHSYLQEEGVLIIDFLNPHFVINQMVSEEVKELDGIKFHISRFVDNGQIIKRIQFKDKGQDHEYFEKVQAIDYDLFEQLLSTTGFQIDAVFGDYNLRSYNKIDSERLILLARKTN